MKEEQKILMYERIALGLDEKKRNAIISYYTNWEYTGYISLKHRFVKFYGLDINSNKSRWYRLDKLLNKRRIYNESLGTSIRNCIDMGILPIRIFHSVSNWLDPRSVVSGNREVRLLSSGMLVAENDDSLSKSMACAREVASLITGEHTFIFSGNKSIHVWWTGFEPMKFLENVDEIEFIKRREYFDRVARFNAFQYLKEHCSYTLDKRVIIDSRRVVPIIGTLNAITMRKVIVVDVQMLQETSNTIREHSTI